MSTKKFNVEARRCGELFARVLASDRLPSDDCTIEQLEAFYAIIGEVGGSITGSDFDDLVLVAIYYSQVCANYECCAWLPFKLVPNWDDDVYALIVDEDYWRMRRDENLCGPEIAQSLGRRAK